MSPVLHGSDAAGDRSTANSECSKVTNKKKFSLSLAGVLMLNPRQQFVLREECHSGRFLSQLSIVKFGLKEPIQLRAGFCAGHKSVYLFLFYKRRKMQVLSPQRRLTIYSINIKVVTSGHIFISVVKLQCVRSYSVSHFEHLHLESSGEFWCEEH